MGSSVFDEVWPDLQLNSLNSKQICLNQFEIRSQTHQTWLNEPIKVARRSQSSATADPAQMVIDAGQKRVAGESEMCKSCRFLYAKGDADEEKLHDAAHKKYLGVVGFAGRVDSQLEPNPD